MLKKAFIYLSVLVGVFCVGGAVPATRSDPQGEVANYLRALLVPDSAAMESSFGNVRPPAIGLIHAYVSRTMAYRRLANEAISAFPNERTALARSLSPYSDDAIQAVLAAVPDAQTKVVEGKTYVIVKPPGGEHGEPFGLSDDGGGWHLDFNFVFHTNASTPSGKLAEAADVETQLASIADDVRAKLSGRGFSNMHSVSAEFDSRTMALEMKHAPKMHASTNPAASTEPALGSTRTAGSK